MNALAEPIELLDAECNAHSWYDLPAQEEEEQLTDPACSERVLGWTVESICTSPSFRRNPEAGGN